MVDQTLPGLSSDKLVLQIVCDDLHRYHHQQSLPLANHKSYLKIRPTIIITFITQAALLTCEI